MERATSSRWYRWPRLRPSLLSLWGILLLAAPLSAQVPDQEILDALTAQYVPASYELLYDLLHIPNDALYPSHVEPNVVWMEEAFQQRGFETTRLATPTQPLLLAERAVTNPTRTVLIYLQIDGQPVDTSAWFQDSPYDPVLKEQVADQWITLPWERLSTTVDPDWRVFARSASDAKGPVAMFLTALDAFDGEGFDQTYTLKVIMDFEEELGSPSLPDAVERYREALAADMLLIYDGPRHVSNEPTLTFGARGIATITLTIFGPRVPQHSGHYGNYAPNPALRLAQLLASMKDDAGRVTIPGYYDGVALDDATRAILAQVPDDETAIRNKLGIADIDQVAETYQASIQYPSLNIRGLGSGWIGAETRTIIPSTATAEIDVRLVPESDPERLIGLIRQHIAKQGYHFVDGTPTDAERQQHSRLVAFTSAISYGAFRTPYDADVGIWLNAAMQRAFGHAPIRIRMAGGSIPIEPFISTLGIPAVLVPTVNPDNNQHSPNENLRLGNYHEGVKTYLSILTQPFE